MVMNWRKVALVAMVTLGCVTVSGCRGRDTADYARAHLGSQSWEILYSVCVRVQTAESFKEEHEEPPPVKLPELVEWLVKHYAFDDHAIRYIDYQQKTIKDAWGNQIVVVSRADKFVGVGSPGPDGNWQDGAGDDIIVTLEDVK